MSYYAPERFLIVHIQRVQTTMRFFPAGVSTIIWCRFGFTFLGVRAFIYIRSWATFFPNTVVFPHISQRSFFTFSLYPLIPV